MKLLIVEDEPELMQVMKESLEKNGFLVETADNFGNALDKIISFDYDCILLDIMLPGGNGLDLLKELKKLDKADAVIIISAKNAIDDKVLGLELGADDYLAKPFYLAELNARVKSVIRRKNGINRNFISHKNIILYPDERIVKISEKELILNRKEFDLLYYFISNPDRLISKSSIAEYVWGDHAEDADSLDFVYSQIKNLRRKLNESGAEAEIQSVYGTGYKFV